MHSTAVLPPHGKFDPLPFAAGLCLRDVTQAIQPHEDGARTLWLYSLTVPAWAAVTFREGEAVHLVRQFGGRRLWDDFERALIWWHQAGEPGVECLGLTITP
ncbi:hypothetical protein [Kitasatospora sp. NPDC056181]|uniref:hypothetical protein n=1 Tax=Kitasatospora sp. NPDC056181 TaxID=3345737 RepID=UPI0035DDCD5D